MRNALKLCLSGLLSVLFACGGGGGGSTPPPPPPPPPPAPLTVLSVNPTNNATAVPITTNVVFTFSASLDPTTVTASSVELLKNNVLVPATVATSSATVTLTPNAPLDYSSVYTGVVTTAVKNTSGTPLTTQFTSTFTTLAYVDTTPPSVVSVNPANNAVNVPVGTLVSVTFSEPVAQSTVNTNSFQLLLGATQVSTSVSLDASGKVVTLTPASSLAYLSSYSIVVSTSVTDLAGNALVTKFTSTFTTVSAPPPPPPPPPPPFTLDTQYLMDSVTTDEVGNVYVSGHTNATPTSLFVAKFDATGKLLVLNDKKSLQDGFHPYGKIYVRGGSCFVPVTNGSAQSTMIAKMSADTVTLLLVASMPSASKPAIVSDNTGHYFITSWGETDKTDIYFAFSSFSDISYTGGTAITLVPNGVVTAGKTNTVVSVCFRDANFVTKWNEVSATSGSDARSVSYANSVSMFFVSGSTFDANTANSPHFPFVKGYVCPTADALNPVSLAWTTLLAGADMTDAVGAPDGSQYAICTGPDTLTKVRANGTLAWNTPLARKSVGVVEYNGTLYVADETSSLKLFDSLTGAQK